MPPPKTVDDGPGSTPKGPSLEVSIEPGQLSVERAHRAAVLAEERFYRDPRTGFRVMTELHHRARGFCCGSACRHCPYDWDNVDGERFDALEEARQERRSRRALLGQMLDAESP